MGVLTGLRVVDLSWGSAGPMTTMLLSDHGAEVIKVEPPGGDPFRQQRAYRVWNRGKQSVTLDLKSDGDHTRFRRLVANADILVESFAPGVTERLQIDYAALSRINPRLIYCSITGYGRRTTHRDRPAYDALAQARTGLQMEQRGYDGGPLLHIAGRAPAAAPAALVPTGAEQTGHRDGPIFLYVPWPSIAAAYLATAGISAALLVREHAGQGQWVETSLLQGVLLATALIWQRAERVDYPGYRLFYWDRRAPKGLYRCGDGQWIHTMGVTSELVERLLAQRRGSAGAAVQVETQKRRPVGGSSSYDDALRDALVDYARAQDTFAQLDRDTWLRLLWSVDVSAQPVRSPTEALTDEDLIRDGVISDVEDPDLGATKQVGITYRMSLTPGRVQGPAPRVGEHNATLPAAPSGGVAPAGVPTAAQSQTSPPAHGHPLTGIRVLDLGSAVAGPFGPQLLADLGAEVIKIDRAAGEQSPYMQGHIGSRRGKRNLALDISRPEGHEIVHQLVAGADVVHHNMRPGVAERLGIDYETLKRINPRLIYCHVTGYGSEGTRAKLPGSDQMGNALAGSEYEGGAMYQGQPPVWHNVVLGDHGTGVLSAIAVIQALYHRARTGRGQRVETAILWSCMFYNSYAYRSQHESPGRRLDRDQLGIGALYRLYRCREGWLCLAAVADAHWRDLCRALDRTDLLTDPRFETHAAREAHDAELAAELDGVFRSRDAETWFACLDRLGVPCEVSSVTFSRELFDDPDLQAAGWVTSYQHPLLGRLEQMGHLIDFSRTPGRIWGPPPLIGQHSREILRELGYGDTRVDALVRAGVVTCAPPEGEQGHD
jgi:crotonobetainyl-CoA:carnitine CoA-transferase CaiB-like acyl-CoA transferase